MVKMEPTVPQSEYLQLMQMCSKAGEMIRSLTTNLNTATQKINDQAALIEKLSKDNLALIAKIESITTSLPNHTFAP